MKQRAGERDEERRKAIYVPGASASRQNLACRYDNVTAQAFRFEFQIHLSIECAHKISLDDHAAETSLAPGSHFRAEAFLPIEFDCAADRGFTPAPDDRHVPARDRQSSEFCCVDGELM